RTSAISRMPEPRGILTMRSSGNGPGASNRCLPTTSAMPATIAISTKMLMMALPMTMKGCRALFERRVGISTVSGSSAVRGLRGVICLGFFEPIGVAPIPFSSRSDRGGYGSPAPGTALVVSREYGSDERTDEGSLAAFGRVVEAASGAPASPLEPLRGFAAPTAADDCCAAGAPPRVLRSGRSAARTGAARGRTPARLLPLGGGSELVTAECPLLHYASSVKR